MEIDYSRWDEFRKWLSRNKDEAPRDALSRSDLVQKLDELYVQWLKQQQKPAHLDFEVK